MNKQFLLQKEQKEKNMLGKEQEKIQTKEMQYRLRIQVLEQEIEHLKFVIKQLERKNNESMELGKR